LTLEDYKEKREALLAEAEALLNEGKLEEFRAKEQEVKDLDVIYDELAREKANLAALQEKTQITNLENVSKNITGGEIIVSELKIDQVVQSGELQRVAFAKALMNQKLNADESAALVTTDDAALLVPETIREQIWREMGELHPILQDLDMTFVPGDFTIVKENDSLATDAQVYGEDDEVGDSDEVNFGSINLSGCELAKSVTISWKAQKMTIDAFLEYITAKIAEKMGNALAGLVVSGKGRPGVGDNFKAQPYGVLTRLAAESANPQIVEYSDIDPCDYTTLTSAMAKIKSGYAKGAAIYAKNDVIWNILANITDEHLRPLFVADITTGGVGRIFGLPVKEEDAIPDGAILIGNFAKGYAINVNEDITLYKEDHIKARTTDYMGYALVDGDVLTNKAFAYIKEAEVSTTP
jgi:HK97 family phage major capsid protein